MIARMRTKTRRRGQSGIVLAILLLSFTAALAGCRDSTSAEKRFHLEGKVVSVNQRENYVVVNHGDIPGFMGAMTMPYPVADAKSLASLAAGDEITADVVVIKGLAELDKIVVTKKAGSSQAGAPK